MFYQTQSNEAWLLNKFSSKINRHDLPVQRVYISFTQQSTETHAISKAVLMSSRSFMP